MKKRLLFVCLGNICRSPAAEGIMKTLVARDGLDHLIECDSAGTSAYHEGEGADRRMISHAKERGYDLTSLSRPFRHPQDFEDFDFILTMDGDNFRNISKLDSELRYKGKVRPMVSFCRIHRVDAVPDPYYEGDDGFRLVLDILEDACENLLIQLKSELNRG